MTWTNPLTRTEYVTEDEFVDSLADSWRDIQIRKSELNVKEDAIREVLESMVDPSIAKGTTTLNGSFFNVKLIRKLNVSYPRNRGEEHPLIRLSKTFPLLKKMIRLTAEERGSSIDDLLSSKTPTPEQEVLCREIAQLRTVKKGKSGIVVTERT
jgi:hypothetical protein